MRDRIILNTSVAEELEAYGEDPSYVALPLTPALGRLFRRGETTLSEIAELGFVLEHVTVFVQASYHPYDEVLEDAENAVLSGSDFEALGLEEIEVQGVRLHFDDKGFFLEGYVGEVPTYSTRYEFAEASFLPPKAGL